MQVLIRAAFNVHWRKHLVPFLFIDPSVQIVHINDFEGKDNNNKFISN